MGQFHPQRPTGSQSGWEKRHNERFQAQIKKPQILPDHFQTVKRMLAPDWVHKMLCIIVPNRRTASRVLFVSLYTTAIVSPYLSGSFTKVVLARETSKFIRNEGPTDELKKHFGCYQQ